MKSSAYLDSIFGLKNRKAVVTGASSGLGAEMALALARAGADVLLAARRLERMEQLVAENPTVADRLIPFAIDLGADGSASLLAQAASERLGACDILIANAALGEYNSLEPFELDVFQRTMDFNVTRQAEYSAALLPLLKVSGNARVVYLASIYSSGGPVGKGDTLTAYVASKHAILGLTRAQAIEWASHGITVNAIAPGHFPTEMTEETFGDESRVAELQQFYPTKRFGKLDEIVPAALFLCSPQSSFVTGSVIAVDGGFSSW